MTYRVIADHEDGDSYFQETFNERAAAEEYAAKLRRDGYEVTIEIER